MKSLTVLVSAMLLTHAASGSLADEASLRGVGGAIEMMEEHPSVVMDRMDVHVDFRPSRARVDCDFVLRNAGSRTTVKMGFPESSYYQPNNRRPVGFDWFVTWVDGRRVRTNIEGLKWQEPGHHWSRWRVRNVTFARGQVRRVRVAYAAPPAWTGEPAMVFYYHLSTGASWRGPIGKARVRIDAHYDPRREWFMPSSARKAHLIFGRVGRTAFEATAENLEPTTDDDLDLTYVPHYCGLSFGDAEPLWLNYPYFAGNMLWVPVRELGEEMRAGVSWKAGVATLSLHGKRVSVAVGSRWMEAEGERQLLPAAPRMRHGVLYVPLRPVATALSARVDYEPEWRTVKVSRTQDLVSAQPPAERFPPGTTLIVYDDAHNRIYFATEDYVEEQRTGARFPLEDYLCVDAISVSADGRRLIVRDTAGWRSFVLDAASLRLLRHLDTLLTWWDGSRLGYVEIDDHGRGGAIVTGEGRSTLGTGETEILVGSSNGRYFLGAGLVSSGTKENGLAPTYRLHLWERTKAGELRLVRGLATTDSYEPGHMGTPLHFEALGDSLAVFDFPGGTCGLGPGRRPAGPPRDRAPQGWKREVPCT